MLTVRHCVISEQVKSHSMEGYYYISVYSLIDQLSTEISSTKLLI